MNEKLYLVYENHLIGKSYITSVSRHELWSLDNIHGNSFQDIAYSIGDVSANIAFSSFCKDEAIRDYSERISRLEVESPVY
jgi:hypothetical protein